MINIPMNSSPPLTRDNVLSLNNRKNTPTQDSRTILSINQGPVLSNPVTPHPFSPQPVNYRPVSPAVAVSGNTGTTVAQKPIPALLNPVRKGQKVALETNTKLTKIVARLGWNVLNPNCDVDVSAFLLNNTGKVIGDDWFVFYGQEQSPDCSTRFSIDSGQDRELISIDLNRLNPSVAKIVFVLTINEALERRLNFSMLKDAYVRIMDGITNSELVSFKMTDYYSNVTSMMIGEIYLHNGKWKFNAIGNGVARDLAGLCELYGVQVI